MSHPAIKFYHCQEKTFLSKQIDPNHVFCRVFVLLLVDFLLNQNKRGFCGCAALMETKFFSN